MNEIHVAAYNGWADEIVRLPKLGADSNSRDEIGFTPLHWATFRAAVTDMTKVIDLLTAAGADLNAVTGEGKSTPLIFAIASGAHDAVLSLVRAGADLNLEANQVTPLMMAARDGDSELVRLLVEAGAEPNKRCGLFCAADYAQHGGHDELAASLRAQK
jgi:ankyrin repeat protein